MFKLTDDLNCDSPDCDNVGHHSYKCCEDRREHNLAESLEAKFPLLCKGKFSMNEEKFFDMLLSNIPEQYQEAHFFDVFGDQIHEQQQDILMSECEARIEAHD